VIVPVQLVDRSCGFSIQLASGILELFRATIASKMPFREQFDQIVLAMARNTAGITEPSFLGRVGVAG
jgi:hypothetical protein